MVWATGNMYPHTIGGLWVCFLAGLPFYRNQILGDAFYTAAIGGRALNQLLDRLAPTTGCSELPCMRAGGAGLRAFIGDP